MIDHESYGYFDIAFLAEKDPEFVSRQSSDPNKLQSPILQRSIGYKLLDKLFTTEHQQDGPEEILRRIVPDLSIKGWVTYSFIFDHQNDQIRKYTLELAAILSNATKPGMAIIAPFAMDKFIKINGVYINTIDNPLEVKKSC